MAKKMKQTRSMWRFYGLRNIPTLCRKSTWTLILIEVCKLKITSSLFLISLIMVNFIPFRSSEFKTKIIEILKEEGETWIGCGMTYTLFECLKEKLTDLQTELEEESKNVKVASVTQNMSAIQLEKPSNQSSAPAAKKEQLTKAQKRKLWTRSDHHGNKPRGWDWVDIVKHLAQTGGKDEATPSFNAQQPLTSTAH